jgi:hypothetical protein
MKALALGLILCVAAWAQAPAQNAAPAQGKADAHHHDDANHKHDATHKHAPGEDCEHHKPSASKLGFDPAKTRYSIRLVADGGVFQIAVKDAADKDTLLKVRNHLQHVAQRFAEGDFSAHTYIHGEKAPGAEYIKNKAKLVKYQFRNTSDGGQITVATKDKDALKAVHEFLRAEIALHETGDSTTVAAK